MESLAAGGLTLEGLASGELALEQQPVTAPKTNRREQTARLQSHLWGNAPI